MPTNEELINRWRVSAPFWEKHHEIIRQMFAPITQALIADAEIGTGHQVLDVATGSGEPALTLAALVGSEGNVIGVDPASEMIAGARRTAARLGLKNIKFEVASADQLPFSDGMFDAAVCRFGAMFFPSPVDGVREILRVLKPGRKLALAVWSFAESNPFHSSVSKVIDRFVDPAPPASEASDAFRFAKPGKLLDVLSHAGAVNPTARAFQFTIRAPLSGEEFWTLRCEMSEMLRGKLAKLSPQKKTEVKHLALEAFREYSTNSGVSFPAEVLIVSGARKLPG
jgi:ubiquinone/menaquinone biosynthesis C-methylase UbiE